MSGKGQLVFATNNLHKFEEIESKATGRIELLRLKDIGFEDEIPEDHDTLEGNAGQKAFFIYNRFKKNCFADDTGLEVYALNGAPGVYSARYAGERASYTDNVNKLLEAMKGMGDRRARFRTCIALVENGQATFFDGAVEGLITESPRGSKGFGYDPVFLPDGYNLTFAEMDMDTKNTISHRAKATSKLIAYLNKKY
jgi:XTP/dITP diphosphohydrolase